MEFKRDGIPGAPGIVIGPAHVVRWEVPEVPHATIGNEDIDRELENFARARWEAKSRLREIRDHAADKLGVVEAQIFEPQILMLDDTDLVAGTVRYIRENHFSAARAFQLQVLEIQSAWRKTGHSMMVDRLYDLLDVELRVLCQLLGQTPPDLVPTGPARKVILVAKDLTPTITVQLDPTVVLGIALDGGTRTSHSSILARAMHLPTVVNLGDLSEQVRTGDELILDGRAGRVLVRPTQQERVKYRARDIKVREWEQELLLLSHLESVTVDGQLVVLRSNIDLPSEADTARMHGAQGVGLLRTEFLVVGRRSMPDEEEQYRAYREALQRFVGHPVFIRTFDLGGDKFPPFLNLPAEENPFLGWRAIRLCLDMPELFRTQLRAMLRASAHGDLRIMLPLINEIAEVQRTRELLQEEEEQLQAEGIAFSSEYRVGVMIETPAAALIAGQLAEVSDFFSLGTNDLVQYTLAVDRGNARLAPRLSPFHPAVLELMHQTVKAGQAAGIEVGVCGELATHPLGIFLILGLGINAFSVAPASLPETKKVLRSVSAAEARAVAAAALRARSHDEVVAILTEGIAPWIDLSLFSGRWELSSME